MWEYKVLHVSDASLCDVNNMMTTLTTANLTNQLYIFCIFSYFYSLIVILFSGCILGIICTDEWWQTFYAWWENDCLLNSLWSPSVRETTIVMLNKHVHFFVLTLLNWDSLKFSTWCSFMGIRSSAVCIY